MTEDGAVTEDGAGPGDRTVTGDLQPLAVKRRNKAFLSGAALLHKALFYADFVGEIQNFFIFCGGNPAVDFRKGSDLGKRGVLVHNADKNVIVIGVVEVAQDFLGICGLSREQQVADDDTPLKQAAFCIENGSPCLAEHLRKSGGGLFKIVSCMGISGGCVRGKVFKVGEINVHQPLQEAEGGSLLVAGGVVYHGNGQALLPGCLQGKAELGDKVGGGYEIDVDGALGLKLKKYLREPFYGYLPACVSQGDIVVLTVNALEVTAREKNSPGACGAANAGLLPVVKGGPGGGKAVGLAAEALFPKHAVYMAAPWAKRAV